jgi:cob(I)alamin adenosyltransferase
MSMRLFKLFLCFSAACVCFQGPTQAGALPGRLSPPTSAISPEKKPVEDPITPPTAVSNEVFHQEMARLRQLLNTERGPVWQNETVIVGDELKAASRYQQYLSKAASISQELLNVREELLTQGGTLSLQQLGALSQDLTMQYETFKKQLNPQEKQFQSAQLIETAITSLDEAIDYWRTSNRYRRWERGAATNRTEDDEILQLKLQTANTAISNLSGIVKTRQLFSRSFDLDGN